MLDPAAPPAAPAAAESQPPAPVIPTHSEMFLAFFFITLSGFGGTLPWTRRMFVEKKKWMTTDEFNDAYALCQFLPGPNIVNLAAIFGWRMRGASGAIAAWCGFLLLPFTFMVVLGALYAKYGDVELLRRFLVGLAAAAAGLLIATAAKMAVPLFKRFGPAPIVMLATAGAIGVARLPLLWVMAALVPSSVALFYWMRR